LYTLISIGWSDFPFIAFKRWSRDIGHYVAVLVIMSDSDPLEAVRTVFRRLCYVLLSLSVLLVKYFPELGRRYDPWTGTAMYVGPSTGKNGLGVICLVAGMYLFWDTLARWAERKRSRTKRILAVNVAFLGTMLWLLRLSDSATSKVCLVIACAVILAAESRWGKRHPGLLKAAIPTVFALYLILAFGFDLNGKLASQVGRDPTLTDRTLIWSTVLGLHTNPLLGTGYDSFWLGSRLDKIWEVVGAINESHNGYLEIYLNLGIIGVLLVSAILVTGYRGIWSQLKARSSISSLQLGMWISVLFYNMTEASIKYHPMEIVFLIAVIVCPVPARERAASAAALQKSRPAGELGVSMEAAGGQKW